METEGMNLGSSAGVKNRGSGSLCAVVAVFLCQLAGVARAQEAASEQFWGNLVLSHPSGDRFVYALDFEPKWQYAGSDTWKSYELTPRAEYFPKRWIDLVGETLFAATKQSTDVNSFELTPRAGIRIHLLSNLRTMVRGRGNVGRFALANLSRIEWRNLWYSNDSPSSHEWRFRDRVELKVGLNHKEMSLDKTFYLTTDFEFFIPLSGDAVERYTNKRRTRVGLGYHLDSRWRFEGLYIRDASRDNSGESFDTSANSVELTVKVFF
jgi:Protein of unknown function (DUF2490)